MKLDLINNKVVFEQNHIFALHTSSKRGDMKFQGITTKKHLKAHFHKLDSFIKAKADQRTYDYLECGELL